MYPDDIAKTAFRVCCGVFSFERMTFGLKNARATYQKMMDNICKEQIGKNMTVYVDDMLVKSQKVAQHEEHLQEIFGVIRDKELMLNPTKCTFRVKAEKFLGYMVTQKGIEVSQAKVVELMVMTPLGNAREVQVLNGRIAALIRFISMSAEKNMPFFKILRWKGKFERSEECQQSFEAIKTHIAELPLLTKPIAGETLYLYIVVGENFISLVLIKE